MSYIRNQIASAIRSRLAEGLTGARDLTASPFPVSAEGLPAYAVKLQPISTQVAGMGSPDFIVEDRASVLVWDEGDQSAESDLWAFAREVAEIVNGAPDDLGDSCCGWFPRSPRSGRTRPKGGSGRSNAGSTCSMSRRPPPSKSRPVRSGRK